MPVLKIAIPEKTAGALKRLAKSEYRDPRAQAALIIRGELERLGLMPADEQRSTTAPQEQAQKAGETC